MHPSIRYSDRVLGVVAVCEPLATVDGITVVVASVEYWREQIVVRLTAELNADALATEGTYEARLEDHIKRGVPGEWPPDAVVEPIGRTLINDVAITDHDGTAHPFIGASHGGTDSELAIALRYDTAATGPILIRLPSYDRTVRVPAPENLGATRPRIGAPTSGPGRALSRSNVQDQRATRVADRLLGVATPCATLASSPDVSLLILSVEFWAHQTVVHVTAELGDNATAADDAFAEATDNWEASSRTTPRPDHPLTALTRSIKIGLASGTSTPVTSNGVRSNGVGSTWTATHRLITATPCDALLIEGRLDERRWIATTTPTKRRAPTTT